jgi:hypothetical protein
MLTNHDVGAPVGHILLIRRGLDSCAVRFTTFHHGHDARPETTFNSGAESFSAEYDWFYRRVDGLFDTGHRSVSSRALVGLGHFAFQPGHDEVHCGPFRLYWAYPARVGFFGRERSVDIGIELAPTTWTQITQAQFNDSRLHWYRPDDSRQPTLIPLKELP